MSRKVIFLMGAPTPRSLNWNEDQLLDKPIPPFMGAETLLDGDSAITDAHPVKWRLLPDPMSSRVLGPNRNFSNMAGAKFLTTHDLGPPEDVLTSPAEDSALCQFYNHSFAVHETFEISAPGTHSMTDSLESELWTDSAGSNSVASANQETQETGLCLRGPITDLQDIPSVTYLDSIVPQTMTVNLIVGIITVRPPRRIVTRQWHTELDLVEVVVGDETRSGFGVTFWLPPSNPKVSSRQGAEEQAGHELAQTLATLRPRDIVLLRMVGLSTFRERVYGQSLRRGITTVELLHRQRVDVTDAGGRYSARRLHRDANNGMTDAKSDDLPLAKASKVHEWIRRFVDEPPDAAGGEAPGPGAKRGPMTVLPPDTPDEG